MTCFQINNEGNKILVDESSIYEEVLLFPRTQSVLQHQPSLHGCVNCKHNRPILVQIMLINVKSSMVYKKTFEESNVKQNWKATDNIKVQLNIKFRQLTKTKSLTIKATTFMHLPHTKTYQIDKYLCLTEMKIQSFYWSTTRGFQPQSYHYQE